MSPSLPSNVLSVRLAPDAATNRAATTPTARSAIAASHDLRRRSRRISLNFALISTPIPR
jgi:hypothetical protein